MPGVPAAAVLSLAQIASWDVQHLEAAARDWSATAQQWEDAFTSVHRASLAPGGSAWDGDAAEAAQERTYRDLLRVRGVADKLLEAGAIARRGADELDYAKQRALQVIREAEAAGFSVGEDLSVTSRHRDGNLVAQSQRLVLAKQHAATITVGAAELSRLDKEVAAKLASATAPLNETVFPEAPEESGNRKRPTVQAVDYKAGPPAPLDPPPKPSYPVNEVLADATDLDGNRVLLRRGYYDARTKEGFGWDKMYWKHGVNNMNVFRDLISHSRPISNKGGTLVYEIPINRVHCSRGLFGFPDCEDTGESLTMRIVANIANGNPDVPDGGQKGVITMYRLPGGSGVVQVAPNWTLCPPWVNNNVPIN